MKKVLFIALIISVCYSIFAIPVNARSGCCSHHGGVCGCGCCDGSSLSATCAPYYPECNGTASNQTQSAPAEAVPTPKPSPINYPSPTVRPRPTPSPSPSPLPSPSPTPSPSLTPINSPQVEGIATTSPTPRPTEKPMSSTNSNSSNSNTGGGNGSAVLGIPIAGGIGYWYYRNAKKQKIIEPTKPSDQIK